MVWRYVTCRKVGLTTGHAEKIHPQPNQEGRLRLALFAGGFGGRQFTCVLQLRERKSGDEKKTGHGLSLARARNTRDYSLDASHRRTRV